MIGPSVLRRSRMIAVALVLSVASAAQAAGPEILNQVPGDAYGVIVINNPRTFANKISNIATRLQLRDSLPPDLLGSITRSVGITSGFDPNGSAAVVLLKPAGGPPAGTSYFNGVPPAVLLVPTTNSSLMLEKFNPTEPDKDGISQVVLPQDPEEKAFVAVIDKKWVALAQKKEDLAAYMARGDSFAKSASADALKAFDANDLVIWGNVEKLGAGVDKWLDDQYTDLVGMQDLTTFIDGGDALAATMEKHGMGMVFDLSKRFFKDAGASMMTVRLTDSGATLGLIAEFKSDSPMGKFVAAQGNAGTVSLKGLPAGSYLVAGAGKWNGASVAGVVGDFMDQIVNEPALAKDARLPELRKTITVVRQMSQLTSGMSFTLLEPAARAKDGYFSGAFLVETSDPQKFIDLELQTAGSSLTQGLGVNADVKTTVDVSPKALTVKDVPLSKMNMKMALREETADKPIPAASRTAFEAAQKMYGPNGLTMYMGVVGKRVLLIYGSDLNLMESAITAAQTDADALGATPEITATKDQLVDNPVGVAYLPIARWVTLAQSILGGGDAAPAPAAAAAAAPPVVMSLGVSGRMVTAEIHVPIAAIMATQEAIQRMEAGGNPGRVLPNLP